MCSFLYKVSLEPCSILSQKLGVCRASLSFLNLLSVVAGQRREDRRKQRLSELFVQRWLVRPSADALGCQGCDWLLTSFSHTPSLPLQSLGLEGRGGLGGSPGQVSAQSRKACWGSVLPWSIKHILFWGNHLIPLFSLGTLWSILNAQEMLIFMIVTGTLRQSPAPWNSTSGMPDMI